VSTASNPHKAHYPQTIIVNYNFINEKNHKDLCIDYLHIYVGLKILTLVGCMEISLDLTDRCLESTWSIPSNVASIEVSD
jgi:hypothetical protein